METMQLWFFKETVDEEWDNWLEEKLQKVEMYVVMY